MLWEELDRLIGTPTSPHAARTLGALARRTAEHLGMVFHRFIAGEAGGSPVVIAVNGQTVAGWDPFARDEPATRVLPAQELTFEHGTRTHVVTVEPYILPAQHQFSTTDAHAAASGPSRWNRQQGLYIYRRERLIQAGGWNRLRTLDEHSKLARVAIDLPPGGEEAFGVNVSKMQVSIPDGLRTPLRGILAGVVSRAQDAYRQHGNSRALDGQPVPRRDPSPQPAGWDVGGDWPLISDVLRRELQPDVQVLDRVLVALVNARRPG